MLQKNQSSIIKGTLVLLAAFAVTFLLVPAATAAGGLDGKWSGTIERPNRNFDVQFDLKSAGGTVTGVTSVDTREFAIKDGKLKGSDVSFSVPIEGQGQGFTVLYTGKLSGDELKLHYSVADMGVEGDFVAKRVR